MYKATFFLEIPASSMYCGFIWEFHNFLKARRWLSMLEQIAAIFYLTRMRFLNDKTKNTKLLSD